MNSSSFSSRTVYISCVAAHSRWRDHPPQADALHLRQPGLGNDPALPSSSAPFILRKVEDVLEAFRGPISEHTTLFMGCKGNRTVSVEQRLLQTQAVNNPGLAKGTLCVT
jgi:hypothetical protein